MLNDEGGRTVPRVVVCVSCNAPDIEVRRAVKLANDRAASGHSVDMVLDSAVAALATGMRPDVQLVELGEPPPAYRYFCTEQADADRLFNSLLAGGHQMRPVVLLFVGSAALAITVVRARRLLGLFLNATIELPDHEPAAPTPPGTLAEVFTRWAARYVRRHATTTLRSEVAGANPTPAADDVSVIIPLYNQGEYVLEAIASVRDGLPKAEIVVVNDGSTESRTNEVFANLTDVVKVAQDNKGLSAARNSGIRHSTGSFIVPLDADDTIRPGFLRAAYRALEGNPDLDYVVGYSQYTGLLNLVYAPAGFIPELNLFVHTHGKVPGMFRRAALDRVGGYDVQFRAFEDWEVQIALHRAGQQTDVIPIIGHNYRRHADSMSFAVSNRIRDHLVHQIMRKHHAMLDIEELRIGMLVLAHFWKNEYEPSASVLLQQR